MEIARLIPAGKLLTIVHDAGAWYSWASARKENFSVSSFSVNYSFWNVLCSPKAKEALLSPFTPEQKAQAERSWAAHGIDLEASALKASAALAGLCSPSSLSSRELYSRLAADLSAYLAALNHVQKSINFSVQAPPYVNEVDYSSSAAMVDYALRTGTFFYRLTEAALSGFSVPTGGVVLLAVKSHAEMLTAMSAAVVIRKRSPGVHICLAEHRYEYFTLDPHMEKLKASGALLKVFDSVIERGHGAQGLIAALLERLAGGGKVSGFINDSTFKEQPDTLACSRVPPAYPRSFSPEPVLWTRLSPSGCYWGKCAFCAQGHQGEPGVPDKTFNAAEAARYVEDCVSAGYSKFSFSDEALVPEHLAEFSRLVMERDLDINWSCRCRCDMPVTPEILSLMRSAGCREILFGLETVSERLQMVMRKYAAPISASALKILFRSVHEAGIGLHLSFMGGFPGESPEELKDTVDFVREVLKGMDNGTYVFNQFDMLPGSRMFGSPAEFKVRVPPARGDMPLRYPYLPSDEIKEQTEATNAALGGLRNELCSSLGWGGLDGTVRYLYFSSGHGLIFKSLEHNPFANPLKETPPGASGGGLPSR